MQGCGDQGRLITMIPIIQDLKMLLLLRHFPHPQQNQVLLGNNTLSFLFTTKETTSYVMGGNTLE